MLEDEKKEDKEEEKIRKREIGFTDTGIEKGQPVRVILRLSLTLPTLFMFATYV